MKIIIRILSALVLIFLASAVFGVALVDSEPSSTQVQLAGHTVRSDRVIVRFKNNQQGSSSVIAQKISLLSQLVSKVTKTIRINTGYVSKSAVKQDVVLTIFSLDGGQDINTVLEKLNDLPSVQYAEPDYIQFTNTQPADTYFPLLWGLNNNGQQHGLFDADIDAPEAWNTTTGSRSSVIGVIDSGVDYTHEDLAMNMWINPGETPNDGIDNDGNGYIDDIHGIDCINDDSDPMDDNNHGTHVAGTLGAVGNNGIGITGVNWNTKIMALKFLGADGKGPISDAIECLAYAIKMKNEYGIDIRIINNSWGAENFSQAMKDIIQASADANMLFITAAGNGDELGIGVNTDFIPYYPSSYDLDNIISVAATTRTDELALFSNFGATTVDLGAPGMDVLSTIPRNQYQLLKGTSMASAHVAGAAALLWSKNPSLSALEIKNKLIDQGDPIVSLEGDITKSGKRLNINAAVNCLPGSSILEILTPSDLFALQIDKEVIVQVRVNDCGLPIQNIDVLAIPTNGDIFTLVDDGQGEDTSADDGIYTGIWQVQNASESVTLTVTADSPGLSDSITVSVQDPVQYRVDPKHTFEWIDATSGLRLSISDSDDAIETIAIGFDFEFYGISYSQVNIDSNGFLAFENSTLAYANESIPNSSKPNSFIAPYWDDLNPGRSQAGNIYTFQQGIAPNRRLTIAWEKIPLFDGRSSDNPVTFEATLYEGSNDIVFQYGGAYLAKGATIGIEHQSGEFGLQYLFNGKNNGVPVQIQKEQAIRFFLKKDLHPNNQAPLAQEECSLDADGNGSFFGLTDGLLLIRHMFGIRGESLIKNAVADNCTLCEASEIEPIVEQCAASGISDIDGNGEVDALSDGVLNIRYLFGIRGASLIKDSVGNGCTRCSTVEIENYLQGLIP